MSKNITITITIRKLLTGVFVIILCMCLFVYFSDMFQLEGLVPISPNPNVSAKAGEAAGLKKCSFYSNTDSTSCTMNLCIKNTGNNGANLKVTQKSGKGKWNALNKHCT